MSEYTELLRLRAEEISFEDDDYREKLLDIATLFRDFDKALTAFLQDRGYDGEPENVQQKARFLRESFKAANIKLPHDFKEWFEPNKKISRKTAFQICFAFGLDVAQTDEFFRCVQLERSFDCHTVSEAVYYFCIKNGLTYSQAQEIIQAVPTPSMAKTIPNKDVFYTGTIIEYLDSISSKEELTAFITENTDAFRYNNATAISFIRTIWNDISKSGGLAEREAALIGGSKPKKSELDTVEGENPAVVEPDPSTWTVFAQIIGLSYRQKNQFAVEYDRSISSFLSENALVPLNADFCFPSRSGIDKLLRGEFKGEYETVRKMLIFLVFYKYWAGKITDSGNTDYSAKHSDSEGCLAAINKYLLDSGYQELYAGNPYDWLFMWSVNDNAPLQAFRYYMFEVLTFKDEDEA